MAENIVRLPGAPEPETSALPHNIEAEAALLGALMIDNRLAEDIQLKLRPDHFHEPLHARIYEQILKLVDRNMIASSASNIGFSVTGFATMFLSVMRRIAS